MRRGLLGLYLEVRCLMSLPHLFRKQRLTLSASLCCGLVCLCAGAGAEDTTELKIRLLSEALKAQDSGRYVEALSALEELGKHFPGDQDLKRRIEQVRARQTAAEEATRNQPPPRIESPGEPVSVAESTEVSTPAAEIPPTMPVPRESVRRDELPSMPVIPDNADALLEWERARQETLLAEVATRLVHARRLAQEERYADCLGELSDISALLPLNPRTQSVLREVEALRNDMEHRQRVAGYAMGAVAPVLSVEQLALGPEGGTEGPSRIEVHVVEMPPDVYADLLLAWGMIESKHPLRVKRAPLIIDPRGRPSYLRKDAPLPTPRQIRLYWDLRSAGLRPGSSSASRATTGVVGALGRFDVAALVNTLSLSGTCRLIAAPKLEINPRHQAVLKLRDGLALPPQGSATVNPAAPPETGIELKVTPLNSPAGLEFAVSSAVVQYEGRLEAGAANTVFSRHEAACRLRLEGGMTAVMGGLVRDSGRVAAGGETGLQRVPFIGGLMRDLATAGRQRELVVFLTWR